MMKFLFALALGWGLLNALIYVQQPGMIFMPLVGTGATPADWGLDYEEVGLTTADGLELHGWFIPRQGARKVVLFLHGNAGNITHRGESLSVFSGLGLNVFIFDYRGYGRSQGMPTEEGLYLDAEAAWRYLTDVRGYRASDIIIFGRSLGGAVATQLASRVDPGGLILESTFSSASDVAHQAFPLLSRLVLLRYDFDSVSRLESVQAPVLVLHSPQDDVIPYELGRRLYDAANEPKEFAILNGDHNTGFIASRLHYERVLARFLADLIELPARTP